ncbi:MAG: hypothetical protein JNJ45_05710 [Chthonomonas sp.]|nr:hypothetical protein [Chthonomonas sp.]
MFVLVAASLVFAQQHLDPNGPLPPQVHTLSRAAWLREAKSTYGDHRETRIAANTLLARAMAGKFEREAKLQPNAKTLFEAQMWVSNLTKRAARAGDYMTPDTDERREECAHSNVYASAVLLNTVVRQPELPRLASQNDVWIRYRESQQFHRDHVEQLRAFNGYSPDNHVHEIGSIRFFLGKLFGEVASLPLDTRQAFFAYGRAMIELAMGEDPLPDPAS